MKTQIKRLSPHQNGKVFGVICALGSLVFIVPMMFFTGLMGASGGFGMHGMGMGMGMFLLFPLGYLVLGYLSVALGCIVYNFAFGFLGGIEYEAVEVDD